MELQDRILQRVEALKASNNDLRQDRERIRHIMNGGVDGIYATMVWDQGKDSSSRGRRAAEQLGIDLPTVNLVASGMERLAQLIG